MDYFTTKDNIKLYYNIDGQGSPIILIHGFTADHGVFRILKKQLCKDYTVITYDLRGHGLSRSNGEITIDRLAIDLKELIEYLDLDNITLVGWSMGGSVILQYLSLFGDYKLCRLCIIDSSPRVINDLNWCLGLYHGEYYQKDADKDLELIKNNWDEYSYKFISTMSANLNDNQLNIALENIRNNDSFAMFQIWSSLIEKDYRKILIEINLQTLLIFGGKSKLYSINTGKYLNESIKKSELIIFEENGHLLVQENPIKLNRALREFITVL